MSITLSKNEAYFFFQDLVEILNELPENKQLNKPDHLVTSYDENPPRKCNYSYNITTYEGWDQRSKSYKIPRIGMSIYRDGEKVCQIAGTIEDVLKALLVEGLKRQVYTDEQLDSLRKFSTLEVIESLPKD